MDPQIQVQTCYGYGGWCILKRASNYIFHEEEDFFYGDLGYPVQGNV
jgi:hypothetical protein